MRVNWVNHLIEVAVVFLGITSAFWLNRWQESRQDRALERHYIESLKNDISSDIEELRTRVKNFTGYVADARKLWIMLRESEFERDSVIELTQNMFYLEKFQPQVTTYSTLRASGDLDVIGDLELRREMNKLYRDYETIEQVEKVYDEFSRDYIFPYFMAHFDMVHYKPRKNNFMRSLEFRNIANGFLAISTQKLETYTKFLDRCLEFKTRLDAYEQ